MCPAPKHSPQEQEALILAAAAEAIEESSLLDFTMSAVSKRAALSMGSIYKHLQSKEDVLIALAIKNANHMYQVFQQILDLPLNTPQRLFALQLTSPEKTNRYCFGPQLDALVNNEHVRQRASTVWLQRMSDMENKTEALFTEFLSKAWQCGELKDAGYSEQEVLQQLNLSNWSLCVGFVQVAMQLNNRDKLLLGKGSWPFPLAIDHPIVQSGKRTINSYQWQQPLHDDDYHLICTLLDNADFR